MKKQLHKFKKQIALGIFSLGTVASVNAQCLSITCPANMTVSAPSSSCVALVNYSLPVFNNACSTQTQTFNFTGSVQSYTVPAGITSLTITAKGAQGASQSPGGTGGLGGSVQGILSVSAGQVLNIYVGGQNGYNGGALGGVNGSTVLSGPSVGNAGNGGGATDIRIGGVTLANRVLVAGGGGGAGRAGNWPACQTPVGIGGNGGNGGNLTGGNGFTGSSTACNCTNGGGNGGFGGTALAGGAAGTYNNIGCLSGWGIGSAGVLGDGGAGSTQVSNGHGGGGGGGGGYYGGGCGANGSNTTPGGGGGGGSSFVGTLTNTVVTSGTNTGNGQVIIAASPSSTLMQTAGLPTGSNFNLGTTTQAFTVTDGTNTNSCMFTVTVIDVITPNITCPGNVSQCSASVASISPVSILDNCPSPIVTYSLSGATTGTGTANASGTFSTGVTNVTYSAKDASGNTGTCSFSVTVNVSPTVTAVSNSVVICSGQTVSLTASGASSYTWNTAATTTVIAVSPSVTTTYSVTGSSANNCTNTFAITQSVSACTSINESEINSSTINVFPNPNNGEFNVNLNSISENTIIEVYNAIGQLIVKQKANRLTNSLNLKNEVNGIYTIRIIENGEVIQKTNIIKQ